MHAGAINPAWGQGKEDNPRPSALKLDITWDQVWVRPLWSKLLWAQQVSIPTPAGRSTAPGEPSELHVEIHGIISVMERMGKFPSGRGGSRVEGAGAQYKDWHSVRGPGQVRQTGGSPLEESLQRCPGPAQANLLLKSRYFPPSLGFYISFFRFSFFNSLLVCACRHAREDAGQSAFDSKTRLINNQSHLTSFQFPN